MYKLDDSAILNIHSKYFPNILQTPQKIHLDPSKTGSFQSILKTREKLSTINAPVDLNEHQLRRTPEKSMVFRPYQLSRNVILSGTFLPAAPSVVSKMSLLKKLVNHQLVENSRQNPDQISGHNIQESSEDDLPIVQAD